MYAVLEHNPAARSDCTILSLSWKGTVPESEKEKSYTRKRCYTEGWLATGNLKGIVGATFALSHSHKSNTPPTRTNFNLRGHNSEVILVRWNEPFQKMATCDAQGVIFVWIKYEGRWSIELVNDRSCQVSDFAWSHDGRMALICYKDGFVLVGSVTGQRYWSSMLNLDAQLLCGAWAPDDKQVLLGTSDGQVIVMDIHGAVVTQCTLAEDRSIKSLLWSSEKFRMVNVSDNETEEKSDKKKRKGSERKNRGGKKRPPIMAVHLGDGEIQLMKAYDDLTPISIKTGMTGIKMEWSSCGNFLAVGGTQPVESISAVKFYNINGHLRFTLNIPSQRPLSALTWGHNDQRLFVACGSILHVAWVEKGVAPLQVLCREVIVGLVSDEKNVNKLPLPGRLKTYVTERSSVTIKGCIPDPSKLREFVSRPPPGNERLHCTMIRTGDESSASSPCYTLFLEYLGGLVPLLKGRRVSKLRPEFVIYDPKVSGEQLKSGDDDDRIISLPVACSSSSSSGSEDSDDESALTKGQRRIELSGSPKNIDGVLNSPRRKEKEYDNLFLESLPEQNKLVEVTSNIWGTKFKIHGLAPFLPTNLGQVNYRTSLLHLQPRQMTIALVELRPGAKPRRDEDGDFDPNVFSEDEDEQPDISTPAPKRSNPIPIAPIPTTNRSFSSQDLNFIDQEPQLITIPATNPSVTRTKVELASQSGVSIPTRQDCDKDQYIKQGAIPKRKASNRCKAALEAGSAVVGRTGALDVVDNAQIMNGSNEIVDGAIIDSAMLDNDESCELQVDLPRWADSASQSGVSKLLQSIPSAHTPEVAVNGHDSLSPVEIPELGIELAELKKEMIPIGGEMDTSFGGEAGALLKTSVTKAKQSKSKSYSPHHIRNTNSTDRTSTRDNSPSTNGEKSPKVKPRRSKSKNRRNSHSASPAPKSSNHHSEPEAVSSEGEKSKKPKRRSSSCSSSPSRVCKDKPRVDTSDSEQEGGNASDEETPAGTAKTRKAKLMRQYADCNSKVFVMHNKAPLWNENTQVYQLDFGGRVTQESAKNFQVELHQKQVMQFGRIDGHAYTLDFQYPFSALQAFSVALANVTQRLK